MLKGDFGAPKNEDGGVRSTVAATDTERIQTLHKTYTNSSQNVYENTWMGRDLNSRPPVCETGILTRLDHPSAELSCHRL